jgi:hypothetical protein
MFGSDPYITFAFSGLIEVMIFLIVYSVPLVFGVMVLSMLTNEWLEERGSSNE